MPFGPNIIFKMSLEICNQQTSDPPLPWIQPPVEKRYPDPSQKQEKKHEREGKRKPGAKVDDVAVWEVAVKQGKKVLSNCWWKSVFDGQKQTVTFSAVQSEWGWARCPSAWRSLRCSLRKECRSRILSTPSAGTPPPIGSPQPSSCRSAPSHPSYLEVLKGIIISNGLWKKHMNSCLEQTFSSSTEFKSDMFAFHQSWMSRLIPLE